MAWGIRTGETLLTANNQGQSDRRNHGGIDLDQKATTHWA